MGFIPPKEITLVEIQNFSSDLWASICSVLTPCVIASDINFSEPLKINTMPTYSKYNKARFFLECISNSGTEYGTEDKDKFS